MRRRRLAGGIPQPDIAPENVELVKTHRAELEQMQQANAAAAQGAQAP